MCKHVQTCAHTNICTPQIPNRDKNAAAEAALPGAAGFDDKRARSEVIITSDPDVSRTQLELKALGRALMKLPAARSEVTSDPDVSGCNGIFSSCVQLAFAGVGVGRLRLSAQRDYHHQRPRRE